MSGTVMVVRSVVSGLYNVCNIESGKTTMFVKAVCVWVCVVVVVYSGFHKQTPSFVPVASNL